jgi:hypothetical protein
LRLKTENTKEFRLAFNPNFVVSEPNLELLPRERLIENQGRVYFAISIFLQGFEKRIKKKFLTGTSVPLDQTC